MRTRENARRAEELAAVVSWLRRQADARDEDATAVELLNRSGLASMVERWRAEAATLNEAASRLEAGEHHGAR